MWDFRSWTSEWAIVVAASVANYLINERQAVGLTTNGRDPLVEGERLRSIPPRPGGGHLMKVLELLARVEARNSERLIEWLRPATHNLPWGTTLVVITPTANDAVYSALHGLVRMGFMVVLLVVERHVHFASIRARARHLGFRAYPVWSEDALRLEPGRAA